MYRGRQAPQPDRIDQKPRLNAQRLQQSQDHLDHLRFDSGMIGAEHFRADLIELPPAPFLLLFVPEHRTEVVKLG